MSIRAVIFDFDGVITNTEPVHLKAWQKVLNRNGINIKDACFKEYYGLNDHDFLTIVSRQFSKAFDKVERCILLDEKLKESLNLLRRGIPLVEGSQDLIKLLTKQMLISICSGSRRREIDFILDKLGWKKYFKYIISGDDVMLGKPHPEGYLLAYHRLKRDIPQLQPNTCLAIEDSPNGVKAAKAAGLACLALTNSHTHDELVGADWYTTSLKALPPDLMAKLGVNF